MRLLSCTSPHTDEQETRVSRKPTNGLFPQSVIILARCSGADNTRRKGRLGYLAKLFYL
jgi:hypothetical protein